MKWLTKRFTNAATPPPVPGSTLPTGETVPESSSLAAVPPPLATVQNTSHAIHSDEAIGGPVARPETIAAPSGTGTLLADVLEPAHPLDESSQTLSPSAHDAGGVQISDALLDQVVQKLEHLAVRQEELHQLFATRLQSDEFQASALERLHDQMQDYKANFIRQALLPILKDVIYCFDFVASEMDRMAAPATVPDPDTLNKTLAHLRHMLLDLLFKHDIEPYRSEDPCFDRKIQQCVKTVPTQVESDDKRIASLGVIGFRERETIIRKEQVTVYKYTQTG